MIFASFFLLTRYRRHFLFPLVGLHKLCIYYMFLSFQITFTHHTDHTHTQLEWLGWQRGCLWGRQPYYGKGRTHQEAVLKSYCPEKSSSSRWLFLLKQQADGLGVSNETFINSWVVGRSCGSGVVSGSEACSITRASSVLTMLLEAVPLLKPSGTQSSQRSSGEP